MHETLERVTVQDRERKRYADFEFERRLTDEITEASEKLAMVMHNSFEFEMRPDGELYFQDGSVGDVLRKSVVAAEEIVRHNPVFMTELIRRRIELQEYDEQRRLALGDEGDPDVLVVLSPLPDAVMAGADLGAYDMERKKTLVRVYERTDTGIRSTSLSLDQTDREGLQAIASQFGQTIHDDDGSEDILAKRFWGYKAVLHDPVKTIRRRYDEQLERKFGGTWYGGRQDGDVLDALSFITSQPDIIQAHMARMDEISRLSLSDKNALYKEARYNFAAALDRRRHGASSLGDGGDLSGSGDAARGAGVEYNSDCPDGISAPGTPGATAESAVNSIFAKPKKEFISKTCPMCGDKNVLTRIEGSIISGSCGCARDICTGEQISVNRRKGNTNASHDYTQGGVKAVEKALRRPEASEAEAKKQYGQHARLGKLITIGGASLVAYDRVTGGVIGKL